MIGAAEHIARLAHSIPDTTLVLDQSFLSLSEHADELRLQLPDNVVCVAEESWTKLGGMDDRAEVHGSKGVAMADLLHGKWLGHPLHPVLTDLTLGAWVSGAALDLIGLATGRRRMPDR